MKRAAARALRRQHELLVLEAIGNAPAGLELCELTGAVKPTVSRHMLPKHLESLRKSGELVRVGASVRTRHCLPGNVVAAEQRVNELMALSMAKHGARKLNRGDLPVAMLARSDVPLVQPCHRWLSTWESVPPPGPSSVFNLAAWLGLSTGAIECSPT